jgi:hypothetical protein
LSAWREGARNVSPLLRRPFAARPLLPSPEVTGISDLGFGFNILNERGQPILSLAFRTRDDAAQARAEIAKAVAKAVEVTRPALTAAGEP